MRIAPAALCCASLLMAAGAVVQAADRATELAAGVLLYSSPDLPDPNFERTVVLLIDHGKAGSMGLVINRATDIGVDAILDLKKGTMGVDLPVYWGGPVQPKVVLALVRTSRPGPHARRVTKDIHVTGDMDDVKAALSERDPLLKLRVCSGYAGWGPGQLAAELRTGSWVLDRADAATVFSSEPSHMWERLYEIRRRIQAFFLPAAPRLRSRP